MLEDFVLSVLKHVTALLLIDIQPDSKEFQLTDAPDQCLGIDNPAPGSIESSLWTPH